MSRNISAEIIDQLLPQTQCGLCTYGACMPYAKALANDNAPINLCPPGGVKVLKKLGTLLDEDISLFIEDMQQKEKPKTRALIRESECIGCTKCIQACPVDAILGAAKSMHTVITDACTGCELCIEPCPVDCIDLISYESCDEETEIKNSNKFRERYKAREKRLQREEIDAQEKIQLQKKASNKKYLEELLLRKNLLKKT